jgi:hypothetical protein
VPFKTFFSQWVIPARQVFLLARQDSISGFDFCSSIAGLGFRPRQGSFVLASMFSSVVGVQIPVLSEICLLLRSSPLPVWSICRLSSFVSKSWSCWRNQVLVFRCHAPLFQQSKHFPFDSLWASARFITVSLSVLGRLRWVVDPWVRERAARLRSVFYPDECRLLKSASSPLILLSATSFVLLAFASLPHARLSFVSFLLALIPESVGPCLGLAATGLVWAVFMLSTDFFAWRFSFDRRSAQLVYSFACAAIRVLLKCRFYLVQASKGRSCSVLFLYCQQRAAYFLLPPVEAKSKVFDYAWIVAGEVGIIFESSDQMTRVF